MSIKKLNKKREFYTIIRDLIHTNEVQELKYYTHHIFNNRFNHSLHVAYLTYVVTKKLKGDYVSATRAALLHDLFYYDCKTDNVKMSQHIIDHPHIALKNALLITELSQMEQNMILSHMWKPFNYCVRPESKEAWVLTWMDKLSSCWDIILPLTFTHKKYQAIPVIDSNVSSINN